MINKIIPFLNKLIPTKLAYDTLQKANPKLKKFATGAIAAGYSIDQTMDFLRDRFLPEQGDAGFGKRPDEKAAAQQVQNSKQLPKAIATGASLAGGALGGLAALGLSSNDQGRGVMPDEITQGQPQKTPMQIGGRQPLGITEQSQGIPPEGSTIVPPISPEQQMQSQKRTASQKFNQRNQKNKMADELYDMYQQGQQNKQQLNSEDQALLQAIQQVLQM